jgi:hypothetical protein
MLEKRLFQINNEEEFLKSYENTIELLDENINRSSL